MLLQALAERLGWPATAGRRDGAAHENPGQVMMNPEAEGAPARTAEEELQAQLAILQLVTPSFPVSYMCTVASTH